MCFSVLYLGPINKISCFTSFHSQNARAAGGYQGFIQDFQFGGGDVCGLTGMGEYFSQVTPRNGAKSIVVSFC